MPNCQYGDSRNCKGQVRDCRLFSVCICFLNAHKQNAHGKIPLKHRSTNENWQDTSFINYTAMQSYSTNYIFMKYANVTDPKQLFLSFLLEVTQRANSKFSVSRSHFVFVVFDFIYIIFCASHVP